MIENNSYKNEYSKGQALVEYVLTIVIVVMIFMAMNHFVMKGVGTIWTVMAKKVAAPCPSCTPPPEIQ